MEDLIGPMEGKNILFYALLTDSCRTYVQMKLMACRLERQRLKEAKGPMGKTFHALNVRRINGEIRVSLEIYRECFKEEQHRKAA